MKKKTPQFRVLPSEEFERLSPEEKLAYLTAAAKAFRNAPKTTEQPTQEATTDLPTPPEQTKPNGTA